MLAGQELAVDSDGQWLFRQGDLVLGPITASQVVEKLYTGELTPDSPVAPAGEREFRNLRDTAAFQVHIARFEAQGRVAATMLVEQAKNQRRVKVLGGVAAGVALLLGVAGWYLARNAAVHGLFGEGEEGDGITMDPPTIRLARSRAGDEDLFAYPSNDPRRPDRPASTGTGTGTGTAAKPAGTAAGTAVASATSRPPRTGSVSTDPDGLEMAQQFDQGAINRVVAGNRNTLFRCFKEEAERTPGLAAKIPMEFVIGNDGRVAKLWVDNPQFKQGPLYDCLFTELKKWPFKSYDGERATVGLSFNIGKRG
ncbi:MAG: AgmX/PglI C-terminal domain-containing protein [Myxococcaceae bacterium]|nr:MAG: AgmX/PglI C-terminal domain-containing protein [Myxococcaceae bacterium]